MLSAVPPPITLVVTVVCGGSKPASNGPRVLELEVAPAQADDDLGCDLDRVDAQMIERRVAGEPGHGAGVARLALVAVGDPHRGRLADHAAERQHRQPDRDMVEQSGHALAADLLVVAQRDVHRGLEPLVHELRRERQHGRTKPFMSAVPRP